MQSREQVTRTVLSELEQQKVQNHQVEQERQEEIRRKSPKIGAALDRRAQRLMEGVRDAFGHPAEAYAISDQMGKEIDEINKQIRQDLVILGYPDDYLQPVFRCPLCQDTGYVGEPIRELCTCVRKKVIQYMTASDGLQGLDEQNFEHFDLSIFPDTPMKGKKLSQRAYMEKLRTRCEAYADSFTAKGSQGIMFTGATGLGKTYMLNCVAERILSRGFSVVKVSAYRLAEAMRAYQYDQRNAETVEDFINADLLAIDDLGSEPPTRNGNQSGLYYILNERINNRRAFAVTTNLDADAMYERYGDRIGARLWDPSRMSVYEFSGVDVRQFVPKQKT